MSGRCGATDVTRYPTLRPLRRVTLAEHTSLLAEHASVVLVMMARWSSSPRGAAARRARAPWVWTRAALRSPLLLHGGRRHACMD